MTISDSDFSAGLFAVALSPDRLYEFADAFNAFSATPEGQDRTQAVLDKDHVLKAIEVADLFIEKETSKSRSLRHSVNRANHPMLALDGRGNILESNELARALFKFDSGTSSFLNGFSEKSRNDLRVYLNRISSRKIEPGSHFIDLVELEQENPDRTIFVCLTPWKLDADGQCLLIQAINIKWPDHMTPLLKKAFGLTASEIEVFRLLSEGLSVADTAERRVTSVATVRTQIREIYAKTGTKSQLQFIRLAVSLAALTFDDETNLSASNDLATENEMEKSYPRPEHWHLLKLPDGRHLDYAIFGDLSGSPCLFFHNELIGDVWPEALTDYAKKSGLKIILPARPFYRRSSEYPKNVNHLEQTSKDFLCLLDHLNLSKVRVLSQTLGGMFALQFAHMFEGRIKSLCTLSPMLPFSTTDQQNEMPPLHRFISSMVLKAPWMVEFVARAGFAFYLKDGPEVYLKRTFSSAPIDKKTLANPKHLKSLCRGLQFGERNGHKPYVAGFKHIVKNPIDMMRGLNAPMTIIIGDQDKNTRMERAQSLLDAGVKLNVVSAKDGGELLIFTHPKLIIDTLVSG